MPIYHPAGVKMWLTPSPLDGRNSDPLQETKVTVDDIEAGFGFLGESTPFKIVRVQSPKPSELPRALTVHASLSHKAHTRCHPKQHTQDLKVEVFCNGRLTGTWLLSKDVDERVGPLPPEGSDMARVLAFGGVLFDHFEGQGGVVKGSVAGQDHPPAMCLTDVPQPNQESGVETRWRQICAALAAEADQRSVADDSNVPPSTAFLKDLARMSVLGNHLRPEGSGNCHFGVIDIIISSGDISYATTADFIPGRANAVGQTKASSKAQPSMPASSEVLRTRDGYLLLEQIEVNYPELPANGRTLNGDFLPETDTTTSESHSGISETKHLLPSDTSILISQHHGNFYSELTPANSEYKLPVSQEAVRVRIPKSWCISRPDPEFPRLVFTPTAYEYRDGPALQDRSEPSATLPLFRTVPVEQRRQAPQGRSELKAPLIPGLAYGTLSVPLSQPHNEPSALPGIGIAYDTQSVRTLQTRSELNTSPVSRTTSQAPTVPSSQHHNNRSTLPGLGTAGNHHPVRLLQPRSEYNINPPLGGVNLRFPHLGPVPSGPLPPMALFPVPKPPLTSIPESATTVAPLVSEVKFSSLGETNGSSDGSNLRINRIKVGLRAGEHPLIIDRRFSKPPLLPSRKAKRSEAVEAHLHTLPDDATDAEEHQARQSSTRSEAVFKEHSVLVGMRFLVPGDLGLK